MKNKIILASASPRRRELLAWAGVDFQVITGSGEEHIRETEPSRIVEELSAEKLFRWQRQFRKRKGQW